MKHTLLVAAVASALILCSAPARADDFNFTIVGTVDPGTVTGEIFGLQPGVSTPTDVKVFSSTAAGVSSTYDFGTTNSTYLGSFTDTGGVVTSGSFDAYVGASGTPEVFFDFFGGDNGYGNGGTSSGELNQGGFAGATYTLATSVSAAPEPGAWALMLGGVGAIGLMLRRRRTALTAA